MKIVFIQGSSKVKVSSKDKYYVDGTFNNNVFDSYYSLASDVKFVLRKDNSTLSDDLLKKYNNISNKYNIILLDDIYSSPIKSLSILKRKAVYKQIEEYIKGANKVIVRSPGNFYTTSAIKICQKYKIPYLVEVTGFVFELNWYHSMMGKVVAFSREHITKKNLISASFAIYVTEKALQKRYPTRGKSIGCSDVRIATDINNEIENIRTKKNKETKTINMCTVASLNLKWKGQKDVIKAIKKLTKLGYNVKYHLVGAGNYQRLLNLSKKYGVVDKVNIVGPLPHQQVFEFLDEMDIYVQPSYQEGLCRSIVEAMSRGMMVVASNIGGNFELLENEYLYPAKDIKKLVHVLKRVIDSDNFCSERNYLISQKFSNDNLNKKRNKFYSDFVMSNDCFIDEVLK